MNDEFARIEKAYEPTFVTVRGAARIACCTSETIRNWIEQGLPAKKIRREPGMPGRQEITMIDIEDLDDFKAKKYAKK
jgi:hypothetical protein